MLYAILIAVVLVADQWLKYWVTANIALDTGSQALIPGVIKLVNINNSGAAFGLFEGSAAARWIFIGLAVAFAVLVIILVARRTMASRFCDLCLILALAGAAGNCIDRVLYGCVVDMFKVEFVNFAVFNLADAVLVVACILFVIAVLFGGKKRSEKPEKAETDEPVSEPETTERNVKILRRKLSEDTAEHTEKLSEEEEMRSLADDEEFWAKLKFATGKGEKPVPKPEPEPMPEPEPLFEESIFDLPDIPEQAPVEPEPAAEDSFDLDSIMAEFRDL